MSPVLLAAAFVAVAGIRADAQQVPPALGADSLAVGDSLASADSVRLFPSPTPGGAFLRAVLLPGWGHASIGAHNRAGFYFALETASVYALIRTHKRLSEVTARASFREVLLRADLRAQGVTDPLEVEAALNDDAALADLRALTEARRDQQEDWVAFGLFLLFLSGADAYVSAHLRDFPTPLEFEGRPVEGGGFEVGVRVRLPN